MSIKKLVSLCLAVVLLLSAVGCNSNIKVPGVAQESVSSQPTAREKEKERVVNEAQAYLEENYPDDEFTYVSGRSPDWAYPYYEIGFTSKKYDEQQVIVYGISDDEIDTDTTVYDYYDNYYQYFMQDEAKEYFESDIKECFGEEVEFRVSLGYTVYLAQKVNNKKDFEECLDSKIPFLNIFIFSEKKIDENETNIYSYLNKMLESDIYIDVSYICLKDNSLNKIKDKTLEDIGKNKNILYYESEYYSVLGEITAYGKNSY